MRGVYRVLMRNCPVSEDSPIHANNAHYAVLEVHRPGAALVNNGFDGIAVKKGEKYDFSVFPKCWMIRKVEKCL